MIFTSDGQSYQDEFDFAVASVSPTEARTEDLNKSATTEPRQEKTPEKPFTGLSGATLDLAPQESILTEDFLTKLGQTWPAEAVKSFGRALTLPGRVYRGEVDLNTPEGQEAVQEMAMEFLGGGLLTAPMRPGVGIFGGRMTQKAVQTAERMERDGFSDVSIKELTGLERGADKMWRKEFSDADADLMPNGFKKERIGTDDLGENLYQETGFLDEILKHDRLFESYPDSANIRVVKDPNLKDNQLGMFVPTDNAIHLNPSLNGKQTREVLLHEIQHWVQFKEGFSYGTPTMMTPEQRLFFRDRLIKRYGKKQAERVLEIAERGNIDQARGLAKEMFESADFQVYRTLANEAEARNVEARANMTARDIINRPGRYTEDVRRDDQIIMFNRNEPYLQE